MSAQKSQKLILKIFLKTNTISLSASNDKRSLLSDYLLEHMKNKTLCVFRDDDGNINGACQGNEIVGFCFETLSENRYLLAATKYFELSARQMEENLQSESWKSGDSER